MVSYSFADHFLIQLKGVGGMEKKGWGIAEKGWGRSYIYEICDAVEMKY